VTVSSKIVRKYNLDINHYPEVLERMKKKSLRFALYEREWSGCEERFCLHDEILGYLVEELHFKKKFQEAWSIIKRYNLLQKGLIKKKEPLEYFEKNQEFKILPNPIWEKDAFNPFEENLGIYLPGHYINLRDFGVTEKDVYYVDDVKHENFELSKKVLESSEMVIKKTFQ